MSEQHTRPDQEQPLFHNTDEQEQVYAPQQVPGAARPAADDGEQSASTDAALGDDTDSRRFVPVRPVIDANYPVIAPAAPTDDQPADGGQRGE